jgi:type VI secretion system protein ImpL
MIAESGLAGVNRRVELQKAAAQLGAYAALVLVAVIGLIGMSVSYGRNRTYITDVAADVASLRSALPPTSVAALEMLLPRLAAVESVVQSADRYRASVPWGMTWGLYQCTALGNAARDAYSRELDGALLEQVAARVRQRLTDYAGDPDQLFSLSRRTGSDQPERLDRSTWPRSPPGGPPPTEQSAGGRGSVPSLREPTRVGASPPDSGGSELVEKARRTPPPMHSRLIYSQIKIGYGADLTNAVRLDGLGAEKVFRRRSGRKLSEPISALFSKEGFNQVVSQDADQLERKFAADRWVWGESRMTPMDSARLKTAVMDLYENDYIATWDGVLSDIGLSASGGTAEAARVLRSRRARRHHFRNSEARRRTRLVSTEKPTGIIGNLQKQGSDLVKSARKAVGITVVTPGVRIPALRVHSSIDGG